MKSNILKKEFKKFLIKIITFALILSVCFFLFKELPDKIDYTWLYNQSPEIYYKIKYTIIDLSNGFILIIIMILIWITYFIHSLIKVFKKINYYFNIITNSIEKVFESDIYYINLPEGLIDIENKLNNLKQSYEAKEKESLALEQKKDDLIVYLAHDIKTPLTSMIGYLSILDEIEDIPTKQRKKYTHIALEKSYRLEDLINELFDIARFNTKEIVLEKEKLNLNLLLEQIIDDFYPILKERNQKINLHFQKKIEINGDSQNLGRVFNNLITNAISYGNKESDINIKLTTNYSYALVDIINDGKEIPEEKLNQLFEKFYRLDASRNSHNGGSGLGLAIAKEIVELHDGKISASSNNKKIVFHIEIPLYKKDAL